MAIDRSRYGATSINAMKEQDEKMGDLLNSGSSTRADYHKLKDGLNKFRAYPGIDGETFYVPKVTNWLPLEVNEKDAKGNETGKKVVKNMPVFNARIHGGYGKDLVEEYIKFVTMLLNEEIRDDAERKKRINVMYNGKSDTKISPDKKWVMYADCITPSGKTFGRLEFGVSVKDQLNKLAASEDPDEPIQTDPYSDPDGGRIFYIKKNSNENDPNKIYAVSIDLNKVTPLTDEELEKFEKFDSIFKQFKNVFKRSDFDKQLEGLKRYDDTQGFGAFADERWLDICDELDEMIPEEDANNDKKVEEKNTTTKAQVSTKKEAVKSEPKKAKSKGDMFDDMGRKELKTFIMDEELEISGIATLGEDDLRDAIRKAMSEKQNATPFKDDQEDDEVGVAVEVSSAKTVANDKLDAMKAKFAKK